ncbi:MAG TPA: RloB family protein [Saprospiraceae bacterium]|nr:RloB family protein [Saprospiraceae bacterium]HMQ82017.1 RloB family protein [Saprospiraceae bacterium]
MLIQNRLFEKEAPDRNASCIYLFCEGIKRELEYFRFFQNKDSRLKVEVYPFSPNEDNSPRGLMDMAKKCFFISDENLSVKYEIQEEDEVWIVLDSDPDKWDSRRTQIEEVKKFCMENKGWNVAESNPCFEVWLYYHRSNVKAEFEGEGSCKNWKQLVDQEFKGGFDSRKHPINIETATNNAKLNYAVDENEKPLVGSTAVFRLGHNLLKLLKPKIDKALKKMQTS